MHPILRFSLVVAALAGACLIGRVIWPAISANLLARKSWTRTEAEVRAMPGDIEFELGTEDSPHRAFAKVDHQWGLSLFRKVPVFLDPDDASRVKPAGFLQMWLGPVELAGLLLFLIVAAVTVGLIGTGPVTASPNQAQWLFTASPGPAVDGLSLRPPANQWKIVMAWSLLGVAMATIVLIAKILKV